MKLLNTLKEKCQGTYFKIATCGSVTVGALALSTVAHADSDVSTVTSSITTALTSAKTDFVTAIAAIVTVAIAFFIVKFVVKEGIGFFKNLASK